MSTGQQVTDGQRKVPAYRGLGQVVVRLAAPRLGRSLAVLGLLTLIVFHAWLLWRRIDDGHLFDTEVALRWLASGLLLAALVWLRRQQISLLQGHSARVLWLCVLLLHSGVSAPALSQAGELLHTLPLGLVGLIALPAVGVSWIAERLRGPSRIALVGYLLALRPAPVENRCWALAPVRRFPPLQRRPPPVRVPLRAS